MSFDFLNEQKETNNKGLQAIVLGQSGGGKSYLVGTYPGKVLMLYCKGEHHGPQSAKKNDGSDVVAVPWDQKKAEGGSFVSLDADAQYSRLMNMLKSGKDITEAGFKAVVIDSLNQLEQMVRSTTAWRAKCSTSKGGHNNFAEPQATVDMLAPIHDALIDLHEQHGIDYVMTCKLEVNEVADSGEILMSKPALSGFQVAESMVQRFQDIMVVGTMVNKKGDVGHILQNQAGVRSQSKDESGRIKKQLGYKTRLGAVNNLPPYIKADLKEVLKLKRGE